MTVSPAIIGLGLTEMSLKPGALATDLAAVAVAIFFWTQNTLFLQLDGIANWTDVASTIGIPAVAVAIRQATARPETTRRRTYGYADMTPPLGDRSLQWTASRTERQQTPTS